MPFSWSKLFSLKIYNLNRIANKFVNYKVGKVIKNSCHYGDLSFRNKLENDYACMGVLGMQNIVI